MHPPLCEREKRKVGRKLSFSVRCFYFTFMSIEKILLSSDLRSGEEEKLCLINFKLTIPFRLFACSISSCFSHRFRILHIFVKNNFPLTARKTTFLFSFFLSSTCFSVAAKLFTQFLSSFWIMQRRCFKYSCFSRKRLSDLSLSIYFLPHSMVILYCVERNRFSSHIQAAFRNQYSTASCINW